MDLAGGAAARRGGGGAVERMQVGVQASVASVLLADPQLQNAGVPTRLRPPLLPADAIARPRLTAAILEGVAGPLTLVCAPAGFGKTVAVAQKKE